VLVEAVNLEKFGVWSGEVPLPQHVRPNALAAVQATLTPDLPLLGLFGYEQTSYAPHLALGGQATGDFHFSVTHSRASTLPVTLVCPWGQPVAHFLAPPPPKAPGRLVAYFSEHGEDASHEHLVEGLLAAAGAEGVHAYAHRANVAPRFPHDPRTHTGHLPGRPGPGAAAGALGTSLCGEGLSPVTVSVISHSIPVIRPIVIDDEVPTRVFAPAASLRRFDEDLAGSVALEVGLVIRGVQTGNKLVR
jgi:hypothetical protein